MYMKRILLIADTSGLSAQGFDEARAEPFEDVAAQYQVILPADHMADVPHLSPGIAAAFLVTDLGSYERLKDIDLPGDLLFRPSPTARLDMLKRDRRTLVVTRFLASGTFLEESHIGEEQGGFGVDISLKSDFLGRSVHYDLEAGSVLDFGMISEDPTQGEPS